MCLAAVACSGTDLDRGDSAWRYATGVDAGSVDAGRGDAGHHDGAIDGAYLADAGVADATRDAHAVGDADCDNEPNTLIACVVDGPRVTARVPVMDYEFGRSVGLDGDTLVVGGGFVYARVGDAWPEQAHLTGNGPTGVVALREGAAISGDTAVFGRGEDGAVYVFVRNGTVWTQQARIDAVLGATWLDRIGVAVSGDTLAIGEQGVVHVLVREGSTWIEQARLTATDQDLGDGLYGAVAISGDTIVVAGYRAADPRAGVGAAFVFVRDGDTWSQQARLVPSMDPVECFRCGAEIGFGSSVAISGDTIAVGASGERSNATGVNGSNNTGNPVGSGAAYVFVRAAGRWSQQARVRPEEPLVENSGVTGFGIAVAVSGDDMVIGAPGSGWYPRVYVFGRYARGWSERFFVAGGERVGGWFASSLAVSGGTLAVGNWADDDGVGAVYVLR